MSHTVMVGKTSFKLPYDASHCVGTFTLTSADVAKHMQRCLSLKVSRYISYCVPLLTLNGFASIARRFVCGPASCRHRRHRRHEGLSAGAQELSSRTSVRGTL